MALICQKCGHTGFQEVLIYCRQCRIACEHKYCLYQFPKKGEKVRWYCEDCRPTLIASNDRAMDQMAPNTQLNHLIPPSANDDLTVHDASPPLTITHRDNSHRNPEVCTPEPMVDFVWRGCISFGNEDFIPFRAHASSQACQRVFDAAKSLPPILPMDGYLRRELHKSTFKDGPPSGDHIGLYLIPDVYAKHERVSCLVDDIMTKDLIFVFIFGEIELLVFPSCILPEEYHKINDQYYLWGAFRDKQLQGTVTSTNHDSKQLSMKIQDKSANAVTVTSTSEGNQKPELESEIKHAEDKVDADTILFGSPISEKLKCILAEINKKHAQNIDVNSPFRQTTIEHTRAKYREEETDAWRLNRCAEIRNGKHVQNKKENPLNQRDRENSIYNTRSKTLGDWSNKRARSRHQDQVYKNLTKRQKALYDSKNIERNGRKTETEEHVEDSKKREFQEEDNCGSSSLYAEKKRRLDEEMGMETGRSHGTTLSRSWTEKRNKGTKEENDMGEETESTCVEGTGEVSSGSPVSSVCNEEQKQRDANGICDDSQG